MGTKRPPESDTVEYKREMTNSFLKTVSAFANFHGGSIEFGVNDDRTICGIENPLQFANVLTKQINDTIRPVPDYAVSVNEADQTVVLQVKSGTQTPYLYNDKAYERKHSSTIEVDSLTLQDLTLRGRHMTYDELPAYSQQLSFTDLEKTCQSILGIDRMGPDALISLGLAGKNGYSRAAELLSDQNEYPGIEMVRFGENLNTIRKRKTIEKISLLGQYERALEIFRDNYSKEVIDGSFRRKEEEIPETAFREALVNALIHRNWAVNGAIQVHMFNDRIEIRSPGGFSEGVSPEQYLSDSLSVLRNPHLAYVFWLLNLIEQPGTGIRAIQEAYSEFESEPAFSVLDSSIKIVLPVLHLRKEMTLEQEKFYRLMNPNILYSRKELEELTGFKRTKIARIIKAMIEGGLVKTEGRGRSTKYRRI